MDLEQAREAIGAAKRHGSPFPLEALQTVLDALLASQHGTGPRLAEPERILAVPALTPAERQACDLERFRLQAGRAARHTPYYRELFGRLGVDPATLSWDAIARLPVTGKSVLRERPDDLVSEAAVATIRTLTTGTTGRPTGVCFSDYETELYALLGAIGNLANGDCVPEDIVLLAFSSRGTLANLVNAAALRHCGAIHALVGIIEPEQILAQLAEEHHSPGHRSRVSVLAISPSSLGELVTHGLRLGYRPDHFGLRRIDTSGEMCTPALQRRLKALFGDVRVLDGYGMTESWPGGAEACEQGHLHFGGWSVHREFVNPATGAPAGPGEVATMLVTNLPPYRETTLLIRYDTEDLVELPAGPLDCSARDAPAVLRTLGKRRLAVQHASGWTYPADVLEALESVDAVPLPARCGFWAADGGIAVEVLAPGAGAAERSAIGAGLEAHGVPLRALHLRETAAELVQPYPLRADLHEVSFSAPALAVPR